MKIEKQKKLSKIFLTVLTAGLTRVCASRSGGLIRLWLANVSDVSSFTLNSSTGEYTAVTMESGKVFYKFDFKQDSGERKEDGKMTNGAYSVDHSVEVYLEDLTQAIRQRMQDVADASSCGMIAIVEDANARKWVVGYNEKFLKERPLKLDSNAGASGKAFTDPNGTTVVLKSLDNELDRTFTGSVPV